VKTPRFSLNNRPRQRSPLFPLLREPQINGLILFFILGSFHRFQIWHFRRMFFEFRFRFYPIWNRWYANTEISRDISQDLAIFNSSHNLQFLLNCYYNTFSSSRYCLDSLLNEILKLHCKAGIRRRVARPVTWRHLLGQQTGTEKTIWLHDAAQLGKWRTSGLARIGSARLVE
jgi:hypothetical protein